MISVENIMEHLNKNPEEKLVIEKQFKYFVPLWLNEKSKKYTVDSLYEEDKRFLFQSILLSSISQENINLVNEEDDFKKIVELVFQIKDGNDELIQEINEIFLKNLKKTIDKYRIEIDKYLLNKLSKQKKKQVNNLKEQGKEKIASKIIKDYYKSDKVRTEKINQINECMDQFKRIGDLVDISAFSSKALECNPNMIKKVAYAIFKPDFLMPPLIDEILSDKEEIPCKWYFHRNMTVADYRKFSQNSIDPEVWKIQYNLASNNILKNIEVPILPISKRKHLIKDIFDNINEKRYDSALIVIFSIIEGMLWDLTIEINKNDKIYEGNNKIYDCDSNATFESKRIRDVLERSRAKKYLDKDFLKEFCTGLYEERNPVLHGRQICSECKNQSICIIKKIFALDYIIDRLISVYQKNLFDKFEEIFDENKIINFIESSKKNQNIK